MKDGFIPTILINLVKIGQRPVVYWSGVVIVTVSTSLLVILHIANLEFILHTIVKMEVQAILYNYWHIDEGTMSCMELRSSYGNGWYILVMHL